ncbi:MAG: hypothetical protein ACE5KT_08045 [Methanosarcinales archaeon]
MGVRVKLKIKSLKSDSTLELNSLLNTGFESEVPEVILPQRVAELLGLWPALPSGVVVKTYETAGGTVRLYYVDQGIEVQAITEEKSTRKIRCAAVISELEREVLLSDKVIDELEIILERPGKGLWRFREEEKVRQSEEVQYW